LPLIRLHVVLKLNLKFRIWFLAYDQLCPFGDYS